MGVIQNHLDEAARARGEAVDDVAEEEEDLTEEIAKVVAEHGVGEEEGGGSV
jgi:division protein CdvB (Snf7/Vps24/ESCRT-III family)